MNKHHGSRLDDLLDELGEREEVEALAAKRILAAQVERRMSELGISTTTLAGRMHTSRNQILRILDKDLAGSGDLRVGGRVGGVDRGDLTRVDRGLRGETHGGGATGFLLETGCVADVEERGVDRYDP